MPTSLSPEVLLAVLFAAVLHAAWNALLKSSRDAFLASFFVAIGGAVVALPVLVLVPPPAAASWPYLGASAVIHVGYFVLIGAAYRTADLSVAYPLMRGGAPLVTALAGHMLLGDRLSLTGFAGVFLISLGVIALAGESLVRRGMSAATAATVAAMVAVIALYTLSDGRGARLSGSPAGYLAWMFVLTAVMLLPFYWRRLKPEFGAHLRQHAIFGLVGGVLSALSYGIVLWAMTRAPIGLVAALREASVLFALLIGFFLFRERFGPMRLIAAILIVAGIVMMRVA